MDFLKVFKASQSEENKNLRSDFSHVNEQLSNIRTTTENLRMEQKIISDEVSNLSRSIEFHSNQQKELSARVDVLSAEVGKTKTLENDLAELKIKFDDLQNEQYVSQQRDRMNNVEILGIPEKSNENVTQYLLSIANFVGAQISNSDIVHIHRVPTRVPGKPKNIIVKFKSTLLKDTLISAVRNKKSITTTDLKINDAATSVYVNEHLVPYYKALQKEVRVAAKASGYEFVWIRNCKIYVRKNKTSPAFVIQYRSDLQKSNDSLCFYVWFIIILFLVSICLCLLHTLLSHRECHTHHTS
ncbi:hypothetical protein NE865_02347 [Phthorimaea operculella]|nr:hypothetical protein NE865_02347 [Phthorimaea operculella]